MANFSTTKNKLDEISSRIQHNRDVVNMVMTNISGVVIDLTSMTADYAAVVTEIDTQAAANPSSDAWQLALSEKELLVAEFLALKTHAQNLKTAMESV